ncbi:unnamed protein product [Urochloa humidicola]
MRSMRGKRGSRNGGLQASPFFGSDPFGSLDSPFGGDPFSSLDSLFGGDPFGSAFGTGASACADRYAGSQGAVKAPAIETKLPCSLEELYKGTTKKMRISREIIDASGRTTLVEEILTIDVKPGWKKGTKITFMEKGNEAPNVIPADLVFIIDEKPHPAFTRDGNDLVMTHKILLAEALTGYTVHPTTLDGRSLMVPIRSVIHPRYEEVLHGEGMPIPKDLLRKGSLRIKFDIEFPTMLTEKQKSVVTRVFGLRSDMDKDGYGARKHGGDSHVQCQPPHQVVNRKMAATHHGENSRSGRVIYIGSVPVCVSSS